MKADSRISDRIAIAVMARAPSDEGGKTRLLAAVGAEAGADLRRAMLLDTLDVARQAAVAADRLVVFTPAAAEAEFAQLAVGRFHLIPQRGDGLGERLECAFVDLLARRYPGVLIIGSDLPTLPVHHVEQAVSALMAHPDPIVLGPARDGGYYLIGLRKLHPELFHDVPWSTAAVLTTTVEIANRLGLPVSLVPEWYDVDSIDDLEGAIQPSRLGGHRARHTEQVMAQLGAVRPRSPAKERLH